MLWRLVTAGKVPLTAFMAQFTAPLTVIMAPCTAPLTVFTASFTVHMAPFTTLSACMEFSAPMMGPTAPTTAAVAVTAAAAVSTFPHWMSTAPRTVISGVPPEVEDSRGARRITLMLRCGPVDKKHKLWVIPWSLLATGPRDIRTYGSPRGPVSPVYTGGHGISVILVYTGDHGTSMSHTVRHFYPVPSTKPGWLPRAM